MTSKWGFNDGESLPEGVELYRDVYLRAMNLLLDFYRSSTRLIAFNRPGLHNPCMVLGVTAGYFDSLTPDEVCSGTTCIPEDRRLLAQDDAYCQAVADAMALSLDRAVVVTSQVDRRFLDAILSRHLGEHSPVVTVTDDDH